jgi:hypothetical protein
MKRKRVEGALSRGTEECDKPVTLVFGLYRRKERKPVSLIRTCQEPALSKSCVEDILVSKSISIGFENVRE